MIKVVWFLKKADQLSVEEFQRWWLDSHAPLIVAKQGEMLRRYVINVRSNDDLPAATGVACEWDGFAEEWFDSEEDASRAFSLPSSTETRADVMRHVSKMTRLVVTEHQVLYTDMRRRSSDERACSPLVALAARQCRRFWSACGGVMLMRLSNDPEGPAPVSRSASCPSSVDGVNCDAPRNGVSNALRNQESSGV